MQKLLFKYTDKNRELNKEFLCAVHASVILCKGMN
ncbi:hypothetical protein GGD38_001438 [Chitinophagaceae bacterium OAS944]|nr:hypothetical protein [Chitinophagaceae bacterium OAS944]